MTAKQLTTLLTNTAITSRESTGYKHEMTTGKTFSKMTMHKVTMVTICDCYSVLMVKLASLQRSVRATKS